MSSRAPRPSTEAPSSSNTRASSGLGEALVPIAVRLGERSISVADLIGLRAGTLLELPQRVDEPLDLTVDGASIGRGFIVDLDDRMAFAIRASENPDSAPKSD